MCNLASYICLLLQWTALPVVSYSDTYPYQYEVRVYTGFMRHSDTESKVYIILAGANADTGQIELNDGERKVNRIILYLERFYFQSMLHGANVALFFIAHSSRM